LLLTQNQTRNKLWKTH